MSSNASQPAPNGKWARNNVKHDSRCFFHPRVFQSRGISERGFVHRPTLNLFLDACLWMPAVRPGPPSEGVALEELARFWVWLSLPWDSFLMLGSHFLSGVERVAF